MNKIHVIAVENIYDKNTDVRNEISACVYINHEIFIYTKKAEFIKLGKYEDIKYLISFVVKDERYQWTDFYIEKGNIIEMDKEQNIFVEGILIEPFYKLASESNELSKISLASLKLFYEFLRYTNKNNNDMIDALQTSFADSLLRIEVDSIVKDDVVTQLYSLDKEIIVRVKLEGEKYVREYIKNLIEGNNPGKYVDGNYFFRKLLNLERYKYISFEK